MTPDEARAVIDELDYEPVLTADQLRQLLRAMATLGQIYRIELGSGEGINWINEETALRSDRWRPESHISDGRHSGERKARKGCAARRKRGAQIMRRISPRTLRM
jgi:hypothetical protein